MGHMLEAPRSVPPLKPGLGWVTAAIRHAGWWLDWQTRVSAGRAARVATDAPQPDAVRQRAA